MSLLDQKLRAGREWEERGGEEIWAIRESSMIILGATITSRKMPVFFLKYNSLVEKTRKM